MNNQIREYVDSSRVQICDTFYQYDKKRRRIKEILPLLYKKVYNFDRAGWYPGRTGRTRRHILMTPWATVQERA